MESNTEEEEDESNILTDYEFGEVNICRKCNEELRSIESLVDFDYMCKRCRNHIGCYAICEDCNLCIQCLDQPVCGTCCVCSICYSGRNFCIGCNGCDGCRYICQSCNKCEYCQASCVVCKTECGCGKGGMCKYCIEIMRSSTGLNGDCISNIGSFL